MSTPIILEKIEDIDLDRHGVIEAAAGTGKTYTIEHLVLRLLLETDTPPESILVVTFTEKAAGELRDRIRSRIETARRDCEKGEIEKIGILEKALREYHKMTISTIHGFCNGVLSEFAFETGAAFTAEMANEDEIFERAMAELKRKRWPERYGEGLKFLLEHSEYKISDDKKRFIKLAKIFRKGWDRILPDPKEGKPLREVLERIEECFEELRKLFRPSGADEIFLRRYGKLHMPEGKLNKKLKIVQKVDAWLFKDPGKTLSEFRKYYVTAKGRAADFQESGFGILRPADDDWHQKKKKREAEPPNPEVIKPEIDRIIELLEEARKLAKYDFKARFQAETVLDLIEEAKRYKAEHGLIGFQDMIELVEAALGTPEDPKPLLGALRGRYRYALVDEYQDTDMVQWSIFRKIFVEGDAKDDDVHRLFVIGDPKQAIYGFRGADIHAYISAKKALIEEHGGQAYTLRTSYRHWPRLLDGLNVLFDEGWFRPDGEIGYDEVDKPEKKHRRSFLYGDPSGGPSIEALEIKDKKPEKVWPGMVAAEIAKLLDEKMEIAGPEKNGKPTSRKIVEGDIAVLTRFHWEAGKIEEALGARGIKYARYKKSGIFQSDEAGQIAYLFEAVAGRDEPEKRTKALLTRFFPYEISDLEGPDGKRQEDERLFERWAVLTAERRWGEAFRSMMYDTGLVLREAALIDGERRISNYVQIFETLEQEAEKRHLSFEELFRRLRHLRSGDAEAGWDEDLYRIEGEEPKVQIMTIHASKGLEYPVVFLGGGFGAPPGDWFEKYHDDESKRIVYDLNGGAVAEKKAAAERADEDRRLFYVALTRAIYKLYLPWLVPPPKEEAQEEEEPPKEPDPDSVPPLEGFIKNAIERYVGSAASKPDKADERPEDLEPISVEEAFETDLDLKPPKRIWLGERAPLSGSFSSLHDEKKGAPSQKALDPIDLALVPEAREQPDDDLDPDEEKAGIAAWDDPGSDLPRGTKVGKLVHNILETIDYARVLEIGSLEEALKSEWLGEILEKAVDEYRIVPRTERSARLKIRERFLEELAGFVWKSLHLPYIEGGIRAGEIGLEDRRHEVEFYIPLQDGGGTRGLGGYLNGFIDLVFRANGKYYLLDWKTNLLTDYSPAGVRAAMDDRDYHLQYRLYTVVVKDWLRKQKPDFDFGRDFGGVYYIFIRGLSADDPESGIFFQPPPNEAEVEEWRSEIERKLRVKAGREAKG